MYTVILQSLLSFSVEMTVAPPQDAMVYAWKDGMVCRRRPLDSTTTTTTSLLNTNS